MWKALAALMFASVAMATQSPFFSMQAKSAKKASNVVRGARSSSLGSLPSNFCGTYTFQNGSLGAVIQLGATDYGFWQIGPGSPVGGTGSYGSVTPVSGQTGWYCVSMELSVGATSYNIFFPISINQGALVAGEGQVGSCPTAIANLHTLPAVDSNCYSAPTTTIPSSLCGIFSSDVTFQTAVAQFGPTNYFLNERTLGFFMQGMGPYSYIAPWLPVHGWYCVGITLNDGEFTNVIYFSFGPSPIGEGFQAVSGDQSGCASTYDKPNNMTQLSTNCYFPTNNLDPNLCGSYSYSQHGFVALLQLGIFDFLYTDNAAGGSGMGMMGYIAPWSSMSNWYCVGLPVTFNGAPSFGYAAIGPNPSGSGYQMVSTDDYNCPTSYTNAFPVNRTNADCFVQPAQLPKEFCGSYVYSGPAASYVLIELGTFEFNLTEFDNNDNIDGNGFISSVEPWAGQDGWFCIQIAVNYNSNPIIASMAVGLDSNGDLQVVNGNDAGLGSCPTSMGTPVTAGRTSFQCYFA